MRVRSTDVLVIGSGIAGLSFALKVAGQWRVTVITKKTRADSSTNRAQGGIAAVMSEDDEPALHLRDTLVAGAGLCHATAVDELVREGPDRVRELIEWGARFTERDGRLSLGREGGHSRRRILHATDRTGREIERVLFDALSREPTVELLEDHIAVELLVGAGRPGGERRCAGALAFDQRTGESLLFHASWTMLATGGLGRTYRHTTNPDIAVGDGVAMAFRAGVTIANLEFVQFHPTALYPADEDTVLISEAVRGEGAVLRNRRGEALLEGVHPLGSLATRDIVARAIDLEMKETGEPFVLLDPSPIPPAEIETRFPFIFAECLRRGIDIRVEPIPVVPAAHYSCGGVQTDRLGRTSLAGLLAAGEVACTGVHGANRLASNSLLEAVVYSHRAAAHVLTSVPAIAEEWGEPPVSGSGAPAEADPCRWERRIAEVRELMWHDAGIVRSDDRLRRAELRLRELRQETEAEYGRIRLDSRLIEARNLIQAALLVVLCAQSRRESRGLHYSLDHPYRDNERFLRDTVLVRAE